MPMPPDDVLLNKAVVIERCIRRIHQEFEACPDLDNFTHVDAMTLNIERACQAAIDMGMHLVATGHLGVPQSSSDAFSLLEERDLVPTDIAKSMRAMSGFRNIAIHQYEDLDLGVLRWIATEGLRDWVAFCAALGISIDPGV